MPYHFRHAICNEVYQGWSFADACRDARAAGYEGLEIAPFTLADDPARIPQDQRRAYRAILDGEGLRLVGLHWLMVAPKGLHVTTPDAGLRGRSWRHIHDVVDLCADLAGDAARDTIMVFGSPKQRATEGRIRREEATRHYVEGLSGVAGHAEERGVTILVEALPSKECDVVNLLDEAAAIVAEIGSPAIRTMFDSHNAADEREPHPALVDRHFDLIRHVHVNELDGRHPGTGGYDFASLLAVLGRRAYTGWVSLEVFDFSLGAENIARESLRYLEARIENLGA